MSDNGWIGVDFDGTLAHYDGWMGADHCGEPIAPMVERVKQWIAEGKTVKIFTARIYCPHPAEVTPEIYSMRSREVALALSRIVAWSIKHIGQALEVTNVKDFGMIELYDDRAIQVEKNTGRLVGP